MEGISADWDDNDVPAFTKTLQTRYDFLRFLIWMFYSVKKNVATNNNPIKSYLFFGDRKFLTCLITAPGNERMLKLENCKSLVCETTMKSFFVDDDLNLWYLMGVRLHASELGTYGALEKSDTIETHLRLRINWQVIIYQCTLAQVIWKNTIWFTFQTYLISFSQKVFSIAGKVFLTSFLNKLSLLQS